jgi:hypothetical protein
VSLSRRKSTSTQNAPRRRRDRRTKPHGNWQLERLKAMAQRGSIAAGRELMRRAIRQSELAANHRPDLIEPGLCEWLKEFLDAAFENPRQSVGELIAPPQRRPRPLTHAELLEAMSLTQEVRYRVRKQAEAGVPLKEVFPAVAEELNALGYRNAHDRLLTWSAVRRRFYEAQPEGRRTLHAGDVEAGVDD